MQTGNLIMKKIKKNILRSHTDLLLSYCDKQNIISIFHIILNLNASLAFICTHWQIRKYHQINWRLVQDGSQSTYSARSREIIN